jgi:hypothetical protein
MELEEMYDSCNRLGGRELELEEVYDSCNRLEGRELELEEVYDSRKGKECNLKQDVPCTGLTC